MMTDKELDALFSEARIAKADPSVDFMARMLDQAYAAQPVAVVPQRAVVVQKSGWRSWLVGWPAGLTTAALSGLWLGFAGPGVADVAGGLGLVEAAQTVEMFPGYDTADVILSEG
ncbi:dihydroorotate dehydrogenase [Neogemmobacter tilapiae]|uniref:Dihydroorotate dehydrogenase n=1 Tax=Neogemmobacter tilapiae TaxID=875041 RepID=A0A918WLN1_9RHOB|nr:dihydroorotate dehydrogenase [Gemmobacter tilapiae]GHC54513.1 hypothetical protein GCM10007315_16790 [Gemmobacter tilapiae]